MKEAADDPGSEQLDVWEQRKQIVEAGDTEEAGNLRGLSWLSITIGLNILAASIIAMYEETLSGVIALAVFLFIISDMYGRTGNQSVAVSTREFVPGALIPLVLKGFKLDPALPSGPILTTLTDMCGFFLVFSFSQAMLPWLI